MKAEVRAIRFGSAEYDEAVELRSRVLRKPLGLAFVPSELAREAQDFHVGAFVESRLVGCLILSPRSPQLVKMRQVAVEESFQGRGIGQQLVRFAEALASDRGFNEIVLSSRLTAVPFYEALDYDAYGEVFEEVTLPHRTMRKRLLNFDRNGGKTQVHE